MIIRKLYICLSVLMIAWGNGLSAQNLIEQATAYNDSAWEYYQTELARADSFAYLALELSLAAQDQDQEAQAYHLLGLMAYYQDQNQEAECYQNQALSIYRTLNDSPGICMVLNNMGSFYISAGRCEEAAERLIEGMTIAKLLNATEGHLVFNIQYLEVISNCGQHELTVSKADSLLAYIKTLPESYPYYEAYILGVQGFSLYILEEDVRAETQLQKGLAIGIEIDNNMLVASIHNSLGALYMDTERYDEAVFHLQRSIELDKDNPTQNTATNTYVNLAQAYTHVGRYAEAEAYLLQAIDHYQTVGQSLFLPEAYLSYSRLLHKIGRNAEAYDYLVLHNDARDSLHQEEMDAKIAELNQQFETDQLAQELQLTKLRATQREQHLLLWLVGTVASFILVLGIYLFVFSIMRRRQVAAEKRQIELEYTALRAQMNPHFIFNALNSIQGYFAEEDFAKGNEYLGTFGQLMRSVLDQSSQRQISLQQELETLSMYLQLEQVRLKSQLQYSIQVLDDLDESMVFLPPLVLQPFVENAIWHGIAPKQGMGFIAIRLWMQEDTLMCTIEDNGIGLTAASQRTQAQPRQHISKGIAITRERLQPAGHIAIEEIFDANDLPKGTCVTLSIPQEDD